MIRAVFKLAMLQAGRRRRGFYLRWLYAAFLLVQIAPIFLLSKFAWARLWTGLHVSAFFASYFTQHFMLLALLTPAMIGGAITDEKMRGTLEHLLTAHIRSGELIVGKILAQVYQLMVLALVGVPVLCFFVGLSGDIAMPAIMVISSLALVFGIAGVSILLSVWCRTTRDALLAAYVLMGLAAMAVTLLSATTWGGWLAGLNPLRIVLAGDAYLRWQRLGDFLLLWLGLGFVCVLVASWRLRRVCQRQLQAPHCPRARWWRRTLGRVRGNPVLWREQKVAGIAPLEWLRRWPRWLGVIAVMVGSAGALGVLLVALLPPTDNALGLIQIGAWSNLLAALRNVAADAFFWQGLAALLLLTFVVAIRASGSITGEKERGTWQALMLTPLTANKIIAGKHWGIFWASVPYVSAHAVVVVLLAPLLGFGAVTWGVLWVGIMLLATILGSAVGLWCSARAASSWRSLLTTLAIFYLGWLLFFLPLTFVLFIFKGVVDVLVFIIGMFANANIRLGVIDATSVYSWALCLGLAAAFWVLTHRLIASAATRLGRNERSTEAAFDYYHLYNEVYRRKQEEKWESPRLHLYENDVPEMEVTVLDEGERSVAPHGYCKSDK